MGKRKQVTTIESAEPTEHPEPERVEEQVEQTDFAGPTSINLPLSAMKAALLCASDEETRYYLNGFFLHLASDGSVRIVATDGHRMFIHSQPIEGVAPDWLTPGVIVPKTLMKEQIHLIAKLGASTAQVSYVAGASRIEISDPGGEFTFRNVPIDGTFPDYQRAIGTVNAFEGREVSDLSSVAYDSNYLKGVGDIAKALESETVRVFANQDEGNPSFITFPDVPWAVLVLMPKSMSNKALPQETAKLLSGPVASTVAALRAHKTRWAQKAADAPNDIVREEAMAKVGEYEDRIAAFISNTSKPALPAPESKQVPEPSFYASAVQAALGKEADMSIRVEILDALEANGVTPEDAAKALLGTRSDLANALGASAGLLDSEPDPTTVEADDQPSAPATEILAASRAKLPLSLRKKTMRRFKADLNSVLSNNYAGLTIGQLGEGVPIEDWFAAGLTAEEAAERAAEWQPRETEPTIDDEPIGGDEHLDASYEERYEEAAQ